MDRGVVFVAYGQPARLQVCAAIAMLRRVHPTLPYSVVADEPLGAGEKFIEFPSDPLGRYAKLSVDILSPYENTLYMDADTRTYAPLDVYFDVLDDGFDMAWTLSEAQGDRWMWQFSEGEREETALAWGCRPVQVQGGMFSFRKVQQVHRFFGEWRKEWETRRNLDQGALTRAFAQRRLKVWYLGRAFNGGAVVGHLYGQARRKDV